MVPASAQHAANRSPGARRLVRDLVTAVNGREHNGANVRRSAPGSRWGWPPDHRAWLDTRFAGGRHARRIDKITDIERRYLRR
jgi:ribose 5-phosphate isomerase B